MSNIFFKVGTIVGAIATIVPIGLAYGESDRSRANGFLLAQANADNNCSSDKIEKKYQACTLEAKKELAENIAKCKRESPDAGDSCEQLFNQIHQNSLKECESGKAKLQQQCSSKSPPNIDRVTERKQRSTSGGSSSNRRAPNRSGNTTPSNQNQNRSKPSTPSIPPDNPQANNTSPTGADSPSKSEPNRQNRQKSPQNSNKNTPINPKLDDARQIALYLKNYFPGWKESLPNCPCNREEAQKSSEFEIDRYSTYIGGSGHPGAVSFYRQSNIKPFRSPVNKKLPPLLPGQQCTYDRSGQLITSPPGAGTPDTYSPNAPNIFDKDRESRSYFSRWIGDKASPVALHLFFDNNTFKALGDEYFQTWTPNKGKRRVSERKGHDICVDESPSRTTGKDIEVFGPVEKAPGPLRDALEQIRKGKKK